MKKILAGVVGASLWMPAFAFAQTANSSQMVINRLMTIAAAIEAQVASLESGQSLACAALFSKPLVHLHESVALGWGSVGAIDPQASSTSQPMWAPHGVSTLSFEKAGLWKYSFTFYGQNAASTTCDAKIRVVK